MPPQADGSLALLQHGTRLYLVDVGALSGDMFYQLALRRWSSGGVLTVPGYQGVDWEQGRHVSTASARFGYACLHRLAGPVPQSSVPAHPQHVCASPGGTRPPVWRWIPLPA